MATVMWAWYSWDVLRMKKTFSFPMPISLGSSCLRRGSPSVTAQPMAHLFWLNTKFRSDASFFTLWIGPYAINNQMESAGSPM